MKVRVSIAGLLVVGLVCPHVFGLIVDPQTPYLGVNVINIVGGGGSTDNDFNSAAETGAVWSALDGGAGPTGLVNATTVTTTTYNFQNVHRNTTASLVDYAGGGGNFPVNNSYATIGGGLGGDDFSVRARAYLRINSTGTYSIAAASDDGRRLELTGVGATPTPLFIAHGGQIQGGSGTGTNFLLMDGTTAHNNSTGVFNATAGDVLALESYFFERGGGDSFEIAIKAGNDTSMGGPGDGWALLADGVAGINVSTNSGFSDTLLNVDAFNIVGGGGSTDNDINNATEAGTLWDYLDANPAFTGGSATITSSSSAAYNVQNNVSDIEVQVDYGGGGGNFPSTINYNTINNDGPGGGGGPVSGGDDFSVRAKTFLEFTAGGTYSIAAASDDGRLLTLTDVYGSGMFGTSGFTGQGGQIDLGGTGFNFVGFNGTTGHNNSVGVFTVAAGDILGLEAFFFERGGGDSFEIMIKAGNDTGMGGPGDGWVLLADGVFGIQLGLQVVPEPSTILLWSLLAVLGIFGWCKRRKK